MVHLQQSEPSLNDDPETAGKPLPPSMTVTPEACERTDPPAQTIEQVYRHRLPVRLGHWLNVVCLFILIMSGLQIFNAHPALYWGNRSDRDKPLLSIRPMKTESGETRGITRILGHSFDTTGVLGYSNGSGHAFPVWATIPSGRWLAMGRQWHLFFAWVFVINGLLFMAYALISRHVTRDLAPTGKDLRKIGKAINDHVRLRHPSGEETKRYNVLQKLAYMGVLFGLAPLIILTGLTMSPTIDTAFPWLLTIFGGRQAARTIHFIACFAFVGFIVIHVSQVILTGLFNNLRSMITGWFVVKHTGVRHEA
ncbi:MAG TPA: cytochrome b/b6 domain-containing protein [Nitrospiraceae bacterium]|nr:cytochrome b/b6 domain-containing protein [Nitrospiraceae bacterium]